MRLATLALTLAVVMAFAPAEANHNPLPECRGDPDIVAWCSACPHTPPSLWVLGDPIIVGVCA